MIRHLTDRLPVMTTPKWVHNRIQPIAVRDALHYLVAAATASLPSSRTWDIGGPDVLEYGDMMRIYAEVAGLRTRRLIVLPFLTPTIASLWVGTVTPIPPGLARPLIESLECDAVMRNSEVDTIIEPPPGGLTGYRRAVELALQHETRGPPTWDALTAEPAEPLPSDPDWAGAVSYTAVQTATVGARADDVRKVAEDAAHGGRWYSFAGRPMRLGSLGRSWVDVTVAPREGGGSEYVQRTGFVPRGLPGRLFSVLLRPLHIAALRALTRDVERTVTHRTAGAAQAP
jgi:hypothetical protein